MALTVSPRVFRRDQNTRQDDQIVADFQNGPLKWLTVCAVRMRRGRSSCSPLRIAIDRGGSAPSETTHALWVGSRGLGESRRLQSPGRGENAKFEAAACGRFGFFASISLRGRAGIGVGRIRTYRDRLGRR